MTTQGTNPVSTLPGAYELGGADARRYKQQVAKGDFAEFRRYLAYSKQQKDWDDRGFMLKLVAPEMNIQAIDAAIAAEPQATDLVLIRGAFLADVVRQSRGSAQIQRTSRDQIDLAAQWVQIAIPALRQATLVDPADPTPHFLAMDPFVIFSMTDALFAAYREATRLAPGFVSAHRQMVNARSEKWGGSHAESFQVARNAMSKAAPGSDMAVCLFLAHFHIWQYHRAFKKNKPAAEAYLLDKKVNKELNDTLDQWIGSGYQPKRYSIPYLHQAALWYYLTKDGARLKRIFAQTGGVASDVWGWVGDAAKTYPAAQALAAAGTGPPSTGGMFGWMKR